jgi:DNA-directed RNA polymerase specialized sigma24 family protein
VSDQDDITRMLARCGQAENHLLERVWEELHPVLTKISHALLRELGGKQPTAVSLSGTDLLHQAYPRIAKRLSKPERPWNNRAEFYAFARRAMLFELLDHRRRGQRRKRRTRAETGPVEAYSAPDLTRFLALEQALAQLRESDLEVHHILKLRFLEDRTIEEIVALTGLSRYKVLNRSRLGLAYLRSRISARPKQPE